MFVLLLMFMVGVLVWANSPVRDALVRRIEGRSGEETWRATAEDLRTDVEDLRQELQETRERLEFAERLLAAPRRRERAPLDGGALVMMDRGV